MSLYSSQGTHPERFQGHEVVDVGSSADLGSAAGLVLPLAGAASGWGLRVEWQGWGWRPGARIACPLDLSSVAVIPDF